jgi:hypothetical protein
MILDGWVKKSILVERIEKSKNLYCKKKVGLLVPLGPHVGLYIE